MNLFNEESQNLFWDEIKPSVNLFLAEWELKEDWTHTITSDKELYKSFMDAIKALREKEYSPDSMDLVRDYIELSSSFSYRYAISGLAMLNDGSETDLNNWANSCISEAIKISKDPSDPIYKEAHVLVSRVKTIIKTSLMGKIFEHNSRLIKEMMDEN